MAQLRLFFLSFRFSQKTEAVYALNLSYETAERIPSVNNKSAYIKSVALISLLDEHIVIIVMYDGVHS